MTAYYLFYVYLIIFLACPIVAAIGLWKRNYSVIEIAVPVFLFMIIGMGASWGGFLRVFSAMYGISWDG